MSRLILYIAVMAIMTYLIRCLPLVSSTGASRAVSCSLFFIMCLMPSWAR